MKRIFLFLVAIIFVLDNAFGQQIINKLNVASELKLPAESVSSALYLNGSNQIKSSATVSETELSYLDGLDASIVSLLTGKESLITSGTVSQYWRGDKSFQTLDKAAVGLSNVPNVDATAYADAAISTESALTVKLAGSQTITGDKLVTGQLTTTSTTKGNRPCPVMTNAQMIAIASPSNGDCVVNSTNADAMYIYSSTSSAWKLSSGGGGGGTRLELMADPSFENSVSEGSCTTCVATNEAVALIITPTNSKSLKMAFTASTGNYTLDKTVTSYMLGADATVSAWIQTTAAGCFFVSRRNGSDFDTTSKPIINDGVARYYELPITVGATSIGWKVNCPTSITGSVYVDEASVKLDKRIVSLAATAITSEPASCGLVAGDFTGFGTPTNINIICERIGSNIRMHGRFLSGSTTTTEARVALKFNGATLTSRSNILTAEIKGKWGRAANSAEAGYVIVEPSRTYFNFSKQSAGANGLSKLNADAMIGAEVISFDATIPIEGWTAANINYLTAPETFSTDFTPLTHKTTAITSSDPVGTFNTYSYAGSTNTKTICASAPTQTTSSMSANGVLLYTRLFTAASTCAQPAAFYVKIGTGIKGTTLDLYKSTGRVNVGDLSYVSFGADVNGVRVKGYEESTGIFAIDPGVQSGSVNSSANLVFADATAQTSGYFVINGSKNPALTGLNATPHPVAYFYDSKAQGTSAGTSAAGSQTRTITSLTDTNNIGLSLASNKVTFPAGRYQVQCSVPAYGLGTGATATHKAKLVNETDSTDAIIGTVSNAAANTTTVSIIDGEVNISSAKVFRIDHYTGNGVANGLGLALGAYGVEIYTQCSVRRMSP